LFETILDPVLQTDVEYQLPQPFYCFRCTVYLKVKGYNL